MGYFDGISAGGFKKGVGGDWLFFPSHPFGSGFVVESEEKKAEIFAFHKKTIAIGLIILLVPMMIFAHPLKDAGAIAMIFWHYLRSRSITKHLSRSNEKLSFIESLRNSSVVHSLFSLVVLLLTSFIFVASGIWLLMRSGEANFWIIFAIALFGFCFLSIAYQIKQKMRHGT